MTTLIFTNMWNTTVSKQLLIILWTKKIACLWKEAESKEMCSVDIYYTQCELKTSLSFYTRWIWWTFNCKNAVSSCWHHTAQVLHIYSFFFKSSHTWFSSQCIYRWTNSPGLPTPAAGSRCWAESHQYITVSLSTLAHDNAANAQTVVEIICPPSGNTATWDQKRARGQ